jgi:hypothetical protein
MAFTAGFRAKILNGDFSLSAKLAQVTSSFTVDMLDPTTFADDGVKRSLPGLDTSSFSCDGYIDAAAATDNAAWTAAQPFTYGSQGLSVGSPVVMVNALKTDYEVGTQVGGISSFSITGQTDGQTDLGYSVADLAAVTIDTSGGSVDNGAQTTNGWVAHLHVTGYDSLDDAAFIIEDSANNSTWSTIGTFATVTAVGSERLEVAGTIRRYVRYSVDVTGSGSVTFAAALARR